ncbi:MAG TPA: glycosyltransferase [Pyrinomonadaceae bacterium]|jgi:glycosyltransferase involved in cell wall biosynthesis
MDVSITICTYNHRDSLRLTLDAVGRVRAPEGLRCELVVVDNASNDGTAELVNSYRPANRLPVRYLFEPRRGLSFARNAGLAAARGRFIIFTDDDVRPPADWVAGMCAPLLGGSAHAVAGGVKIAPHLERPWMGWMHRAWLASTDSLDAREPEHMVGANMALSKEVLGKVPAFDTELGAGAAGFHEEALFSLQLKRAGYRLAPALDVTVEHHFDESRLARANFLDTAGKMGRSSAYWAHHWEHEEVRRPRLELALARLRLAKWRAQRGRECRSPEGMPEWEMVLLKQVHFHRQYLLERSRPRNYERHGLVKLNREDAPSSRI